MIRIQSILMSIQPQWCEKIASGKKTIEVRKTKPMLETPFKVYIYCTNNGGSLHSSYDGLHYHKSNVGKTDGSCINGKVIGEFVCNYIGSIKKYDGKYTEVDCKFTCLSDEELKNYARNNRIYGWHISNLKIYDKPKELYKFYKLCKEIDTHRYQCEDCDCYIEDEYTGVPDCMVDGLIALSIPPQSWCYIVKAGD